MTQILVVDDELMVCQIVTDSLLELDANVMCAHSGPQGAELLRSLSFDLALIDVMVGGVSGFTLAEIAAGRDTPALLMSGHPDATGKLERFEFPHLSKPFGVQTLLNEAKRTMAAGPRNVRLVQDAIARMRAGTQRSYQAAAPGHWEGSTVRPLAQTGTIYARP